MIFAPYLANIKHLEIDEVKQIIVDWLEKCSQIRPLDSDVQKTVQYALDYSINNDYLPMGVAKLKAQNAQLYNVIIASKKIKQSYMKTGNKLDTKEKIRWKEFGSFA